MLRPSIRIWLSRTVDPSIAPCRPTGRHGDPQNYGRPREQSIPRVPIAEEPMHDVKTRPADTGLAALVMLMRFQGVAAGPDQILHRLRCTPIGLTEMLRSAKDFGLEARVVKTGWARLAKSPLPAIGCLGNGGCRPSGQGADDPV